MYLLALLAIRARNEYINELLLTDIELKVKNIVSQKSFLEKMGINERANILEKRMSKLESHFSTSNF